MRRRRGIDYTRTMSSTGDKRPARLSCDVMLDYFLDGATPREEWQIGMELEKMGRRADNGRPIPYDGDGPTVRKVLELIRERHGGDAVLEAGNVIGLAGSWGTITLEPGGQVEWSSRPQRSLTDLHRLLKGYLATLRDVAELSAIEWLEVGVDPVHTVAEMPWMPKERYRIMREYLRKKGRLAHRMMTQTASIQCAFDFADGADWRRKFKAAAFLTPVAVAMFSNSRIVEGQDSGYRSYRQAIWSETDDDRCGLPAIVFEPSFDMQRWVGWLLDVPLLFRRRAAGLVAPDGSTFRENLEGPLGDKLEMDDWATHCSSIFTEVRSYTYIEVRSADLLPDDLAFAVPTFWTGTLYDEEALDAALDLGRDLDHAGWRQALESAARHGLDGNFGRYKIREIAGRALGAAVCALQRGVPGSGDPAEAVRPLEALATHLGLDVKV